MTCERCGTEAGALSACPSCHAAMPAPVAMKTASADEKACPFCAETIRANAVRCRFCGAGVDAASLMSAAAGVPQRPLASTPGHAVVTAAAGGVQPSIVIQNVQSVGAPAIVPRKSPAVAVILSFFFAGLGQFYNGDVGKGLLFMLAQVLNFGLMFFAIGFATAFFVWLWSMIDAHHSAVRINVRGY